MTIANVAMEFVIVGVCVVYVLFASQKHMKMGQPIWFSLIFLSASTLLGHTEFTSSSLAEVLVGNSLWLLIVCAITGAIHLWWRLDTAASRKRLDAKDQDQPGMKAIVLNSIVIYGAIKLSALVPVFVSLLGRSVQLPISSLVVVTWLSIGIAILGFLIVALRFGQNAQEYSMKSAVLTGISFVCISSIAGLIPVQLRLAILNPSLFDLGPTWSVVGNDLLETLSTRCFFISVGCLFLIVVLLLLYRKALSQGYSIRVPHFIACNIGLLALVLACFSELWRAEY